MSKMKKIYIPYIVFSIIILTLIVLSHVKSKEIDTNKINVPEKNLYVIKASDNKVYLLNNKNHILKELNINFNSLRKYDKEQLKNGLLVSTKNELNQIIEDFSN